MKTVKEARTLSRSTPVHLLARNFMVLLPLFSMPLSFYFPGVFPFYSSVTWNQTCRTAMGALSSLLPGLRLGRRMSPFWNCPWPLACAWSAHLSCLLILRRPHSDCGHVPTAVSLCGSLMPLCKKAGATRKTPRQAWDYLFTRTPTPSLSSASYCVKLKDVGEFWVWCLLLSCCQLWALTMEKPGSATTL